MEEAHKFDALFSLPVGSISISDYLVELKGRKKEQLSISIAILGEIASPLVEEEVQKRLEV